MQDDEVTFNVFETMKYLADNEDCSQIDIVDKLTVETFRKEHSKLPLEAYIIHSDSTAKKNNAREECLNYLERHHQFKRRNSKSLHSRPTLVPSI